MDFSGTLRVAHLALGLSAQPKEVYIMNMKIRTSGKTVAVAGRMRRSGRLENRTFTGGLLMGLSAASLLVAGALPRPKAPQGGVDGDWKAVGDDIRIAMSTYGK